MYSIESMINYGSIFKNVFSVILNMPKNVFGNSNSNISDNKIDTSIIVQKPYLRTKCIESNIEEDIDLKNHFTKKELTRSYIHARSSFKKLR